MPAISPWPGDALAASPPSSGNHSSLNRGEAQLQVLAAGGYGIWMWLGLSLLLGLNPLGRDGTQAPLTLGALLIGTGLLLACLRVPGLTRWHGWTLRLNQRPTRAATLAMVTWLPAVAVALLTDGDYSFWITRLAGAGLMVCSLACVLQTAQDDRADLPPTLLHLTTLLPACRIATAAYTGGLWLWLSLLVRGAPNGNGDLLWRLLLIVLALGLGLLDGGLWQALREPGLPTTSRDPLLRRRLAAALLSYALPCTALLLGTAASSLLVAVLAVPGCVLGRLLDRDLYVGALAEARAAGAG